MSRADHPVNDEDLERYADLLREIRARIDSTFGLLTRPVDFVRVDAAAIQMRKALELVVLGSLITNRAQIEEVTTAFTTADAARARQIAKRINPDYWPEPKIKEDVRTRTADKPGHFRLHDVDHPYLREEDWGPAYGQMSSIAHADNPYGSSELDLDRDVEFIEDVRTKLIRLLDHHVVRLVGARFLLVGAMKIHGSDDVQVALLTRMNRAERRRNQRNRGK